MTIWTKPWRNVNDDRKLANGVMAHIVSGEGRCHLSGDLQVTRRVQDTFQRSKHRQDLPCVGRGIGERGE